MSDSFAHCGCQYEPDQEFQKAHWHEINGILTCDVCFLDIKWHEVEYGDKVGECP